MQAISERLSALFTKNTPPSKPISDFWRGGYSYKIYVVNFEGGVFLEKIPFFEILIFKPKKSERKIKNMNEIFEYNAILTEIQSESCNYLKISHQNHPKNWYSKEM